MTPYRTWSTVGARSLMATSYLEHSTTKTPQGLSLTALDTLVRQDAVKTPKRKDALFALFSVLEMLLADSSEIHRN